ncbi:hypothetical protein QBC38DRAFT_178502 [Podospora fimiseda]|uniref:Translation initiation factor IF-2, mitochondrial n=1 Tax=Podospora fimiseda TaxID=252190 RepID=A0AAN7BZ98_9PEZI|nr:hypothetical protein QBC38DRAFT_178502 [Podospora fimiseda]
MRPTLLLGSTTTTRQFGGKGFFPQWGVEPKTEATADDDLLPHELAAKEATRAAKAAKDAAIAKAKAEKEEAKRKAAEAPKPKAAPLPFEPFRKAPPSRTPVKTSSLPFEPFSKAPPQKEFVRSPLKTSNASSSGPQSFIRRIPVDASPLPVQPIRPVAPSPAAPPPPPPSPPPPLTSAPEPEPTSPSEPKPPGSEIMEKLSATLKAAPVTKPVKPAAAKPTKGFGSLSGWGSFGSPIFGNKAINPDDNLLPHELAALEKRRKAREEVEVRERAEKEKVEQAKLAAERAERERLEQARLAAEQVVLEQRRREQEEADARERAKREREEQTKLAAERASLERRIKEIQEAEARLKAEQERVEQARLALEQAMESQRLEQERSKATSPSVDPWAHLLPHERAAKEQAARELQHAEEGRAAAERQRLAEEERAKVAAAAAKEQAARERQRAEEEKAAKERQRIEEEKAKAAAAAMVDPWDHLLPHERAEKERAKKEREDRERAAQEQVRQSKEERERVEEERQRVAKERAKKELEARQSAERAEREKWEKAKVASANIDPLGHFLPHERAAHEQRMKERQAAPARDEGVPIRSTPSTRGVSRNPDRVDSREWAHLQRKDVPLPHLPTNPFKTTSDPFRNALDPVRGLLNHHPRPPNENPWARLAGPKPPPKPLSEDVDESVWDKMIQREETAKSDPESEASWDWVDEHVDKSQDKNATAATPPPSEEPTPYIFPSDTTDFAAENMRRFERRSRFDAPEKEKPKKTQSKNKGYERDDEFDEFEREERRRRKAERKLEKELERLEAAEGPTPILLPEFISVANLADALGQKVKPFVRQLEALGFEDVGKDNIVTGETAALIAQEYGFEPTIEAGEDKDLKPRPPPEDPSSLPLRPPVVTIMGHVDHGKTTLLDFLRKSSIVSQEHGGITQHIGAFSVKMSTGKTITFLDTPGHAAFLAMRQRGANVTDIVILVVAADDSVKPQTIEAIKHAQGAKVPIIVAINKIDKDSANIDRVKADLAAQGLEIEDYGGDVQVVPVSGKTGQGMDDLEENILLLAEMLDIRSETDGMAEGWVLESSIKPIGRVATVLIKRGTLRKGDFIVAGRVFTKVRQLRNEAGEEVLEAPPGTAVEVLGWKDPPEAGDMIIQAPDEDRAKDAVDYRQEFKEREEVIAQMAEQEQQARERELEKEREEKRQKALEAGEEYLEDAEEDGASKTKIVNFSVKGDVTGSVEAVAAAILEQGNNEVKCRILNQGPGQITEWDVEHASVSGSTIINFNNPVPGHIKRMADDAGVKILEHNVIYHLVAEVKQILSECLAPVVTWRVLGEAEVLQVFPINLKGRRYKNIAGCRIRNGTVEVNSRCRVIRGDKTVFEGILDQLKHGKKDVEKATKGGECGISFENWEDFQEGDHIQTIEEVRTKRTL